MKKAWVFLVCLLILSACGDDNQNSNTANEGNGGEPVNVQPDQSGVTAEHLRGKLS